MGPGEELVLLRQGFGGRLGATGRVGLVLVDFVNGFAEPELLGGGNVVQAIEAAGKLLAGARSRYLPIVHTRIVFAADASDANVFSQKVPALVSLTENAPQSQIEIASATARPRPTRRRFSTFDRSMAT